MTEMPLLMTPRTGSLQCPILMQEATSTLTKSAGKLRLVHLLEEGPLHAAADSTSTFNLKTILATLGKLALLLAVLGFAWQSRDFIGTQYAITPMVSQVLRGQRTTITVSSIAEHMKALSVSWLALY